MTWFRTIYFQEKRVQSCLDAIILIANPKEKNSAHITVRGPYSKRDDSDKTSSELVGTNVTVLGGGRFFRENQNTVFLECGSELLQKYWWKPDYGYNPHITLYDGESRDFAEKLFQVLRNHKLFFCLTVGKILFSESIRGQKAFDLWFGADLDQIGEITGERIDVQSVNTLPTWKRLNMIDRLCTHLVWLNHQADTRRRSAPPLAVAGRSAGTIPRA